MSTFQAFLKDDGGAISIDWVSLTAGLLLLGIAVVYAIFNSGVKSVVGDINGTLAAVGIVDPGTAPDYSGGGSGSESTGPSLADGTTLPQGTVVGESGTQPLPGGGEAVDYVALIDPATGIMTVLTRPATSEGVPPNYSAVTSATEITSNPGSGSSTTYDMSGYSTYYSGTIEGFNEYVMSQIETAPEIQ